MTAVILAIRMIIARRTALMTGADDIIRDAFPHSFVEYKILSYEFVFETFLFDLTCVFDDATLQLVDVAKTFVSHPRAGLFTADPTGAIHDDVFVAVTDKKIFHYLELLAERVNIGE